MRDEQDVRGRFGRHLRELRLERRLSQEKLGQLAGLDRTYISQTEAGRRNVSLLTIHRLADALRVTPDILLRASDGDAQAL